MSADVRWDALVPVIRNIYAHHGAGCCWHVVLDDLNLDQASIRFCSKGAAERRCQPCLVLANQIHLFSLTQVSKAARKWRLK